MSEIAGSSLRSNPFHAYRDPDTGYWVTIVPKSALIEEISANLAARRLRFIDPEDFSQLHHPTS